MMSYIRTDKNDNKMNLHFCSRFPNLDVPLQISVTRLKLLFQPRHSAVGREKRRGWPQLAENQRPTKDGTKAEKKPCVLFQVSTMCSSISQGSQQPYSLYPSLPLCKWDLAHGAPAPTYSVHSSVVIYLTQVRN